MAAESSLTAGVTLIVSGEKCRIMIEDDSEKDEERQRYSELLGELRAVIPCVQVQFAFLLTVPFSSRFEQVDRGGTALLALSIFCAVFVVGHFIFADMRVGAGLAAATAVGAAVIARSHKKLAQKRAYRAHPCARSRGRGLRRLDGNALGPGVFRLRHSHSQHAVGVLGLNRVRLDGDRQGKGPLELPVPPFIPREALLFLTFAFALTAEKERIAL